MCCITCTLSDHGTHDPDLDIPKQSLLPVINTFQYQVQLLVLAGLFTHAIPYMILAYHFWHFYALHFVMFLHFTKFLTIHQQNWNQINNQWCSLNDRSEFYSKVVYVVI